MKPMKRQAARVTVLMSVLLAVPAVPTVSAWAFDFPWSSGRSSHNHEREHWYAARATDPVGSRQVYHKGKFWPPYPRPTGLSQLPSHQFHAAHYWPYPYQCQDQQYLREMSKRQQNNGWIQATTLYDYHFDEETHTLNRAGTLHLRWILQNVPLKNRVTFIQTAGNSEQSQLRMTSATEKAVSMVGDENVPPIILRVCTPLGRPAIEVEQIREAELKSLPEPRISDPLNSYGGVGGGDM